MIADIDFRWVKRLAEDILTNEDGDEILCHEKVLQFRKLEKTIDMPAVDGYQEIASFDWTDWQDVPVVEE